MRMRFFLPFLVCIVGLCATIYGSLITPKTNKIQREHTPFPYMAMQDMEHDGELITNRDLEHHYTLVHFFSSWCSTCLLDHSVLSTLNRDLNVPVVGIVWQDKKEKVQPWLQEHPRVYERVGIDPDSSLAVELGVAAIPDTFLIDKNGRIVLHTNGPLTKDAVNELSALIK